MKKYTGNQFGMTLFESLSVLVIAAILTFGAISFYTSASSRAKAVAATYEMPKENARNMVFGPFKTSQIFRGNQRGVNVFLGDMCKDNFSCRRSFCGEVEIKNQEEVYVHIKDLSHCITKLAKY